MLPSTVAGVIIAIKVIAFVGFVMFHQVQQTSSPLVSIDDPDDSLIEQHAAQYVEKQEHASPAAAFIAQHLPAALKRKSHELQHTNTPPPAHEQHSPPPFQSTAEPNVDDEIKQSYFRLPHYHFGSKAVKAGKTLLNDFVRGVKKQPQHGVGDTKTADEHDEQQHPETVGHKMKALMHELLPHAHGRGDADEHTVHIPPLPSSPPSTHHQHARPMLEGLEAERESYQTAVRSLLHKAFVKVQSAAPTNIRLPASPSFSSLLSFVPNSLRRRHEEVDENEDDADVERPSKYVSTAETTTHIHHERPVVQRTASSHEHVPHHHAEHDSQLVLAFTQLWSATKNMMFSHRSFECKMQTLQEALQSVLEAMQQRISRVRVEDALYYMPDVLLIVVLTSLSHFVWDRITGGPAASASNLLNTQLQQQSSVQQFWSSSPTASVSEHQTRAVASNNDGQQQRQQQLFVGPQTRPFSYALDDVNYNPFSSMSTNRRNNERDSGEQQPLRSQPVSATNVIIEQLADATDDNNATMNAQPPTRNFMSPLVSHEVLPTFEGENRFNRAARQSRSLTFSAVVNNDRNGRLFDSILESKRRYRVILKHFRQLQSHSQLLLEVLKNNAANNYNNNNGSPNTTTLVDQSLIKEIEEEISTSNAELAVNENEESESLINPVESEVLQQQQPSTPFNHDEEKARRLRTCLDESEGETYGPHPQPSPPSLAHTLKDKLLSFAHTSKSAPLPAGQRAEFLKQQKLMDEDDDDIDDSLVPARMAASASCATQTDNNDAEEIYRSLLAQAKNIDNVKTHVNVHSEQQEQFMLNSNTVVANENVADAGVLFSHNAALQSNLLASDVIGSGNESTSSWDKLLHSALPSPQAAESDADITNVEFRISSSCVVTRLVTTNCRVEDGPLGGSELRSATQSSQTFSDKNLTVSTSFPISSITGICSATTAEVAIATDSYATGDQNSTPKQRSRRKRLTTSAAALILAKQRRRQRRNVAPRRQCRNGPSTKQKLSPASFVMQTRLVATKIAVTRELTHAQSEVVAIRETLRRTQMECIGIVESELKYLKRKMEQLEMRTLQAERKYTMMFHSLAKAMEIIHRRAPDELHLIKQLHPLDGGVSSSSSQMDVSSSNLPTIDATYMPSGSGAGSKVGLRQL